MLTLYQVHNNIVECYLCWALESETAVPCAFPLLTWKTPCRLLAAGHTATSDLQRSLARPQTGAAAPDAGTGSMQCTRAGAVSAKTSLRRLHTAISSQWNINPHVHTRQNRFEDPHHMLTTIWAILTKEHCLVNLNIITVLHLILRGFEYCAMIWISRSFYATLGFFSNQDMLPDIVCVISCCNTASFAGQQSVLEM